MMMICCMGRRGKRVMIDGFELNAVIIKDEYYIDAMRADIEFIKSLIRTEFWQDFVRQRELIRKVQKFIGGGRIA